MMRVLDLFSGIGGFSLGLERTGGFKTVAFCEIEPFCQRVLKKHWPEVPCYGDIRELNAERLAADGVGIEILCGGFPCQDVSLAGKRAGLGGNRSGLWAEYARLIGELRPYYVIVENTPGLLSLGMGVVLGDLATLRYDAEWHSIPFAAIGGDHIRDRVWIIAYPNETGGDEDNVSRGIARQTKMGETSPDADLAGQLQPQGSFADKRRWYRDGTSEDASYPLCAGLQGRSETGTHQKDAPRFGARIRLAIRTTRALSREHWNYQPLLGRGVHGISDRVDRVESLGNVACPQITEIIGRTILASATP